MKSDNAKKNQLKETKTEIHLPQSMQNSREKV